MQPIGCNQLHLVGTIFNIFLIIFEMNVFLKYVSISLLLNRHDNGNNNCKKNINVTNYLKYIFEQ
jgi:hypothetical protein